MLADVRKRLGCVEQEKSALEGELGDAKRRSEDLEVSSHSCRHQPQWWLAQTLVPMAQAERRSLQQLLEATKNQLEGVSGQLLRREARVTELEEAVKSQDRALDGLMQRKKDMAARAR
jgi:chromosome segregation ATPase